MEVVWRKLLWWTYFSRLIHIYWKEEFHLQVDHNVYCLDILVYQTATLTYGWCIRKWLRLSLPKHCFFINFTNFFTGVLVHIAKRGLEAVFVLFNLYCMHFVAKYFWMGPPRMRKEQLHSTRKHEYFQPLHYALLFFSLKHFGLT